MREGQCSEIGVGEGEEREGGSIQHPCHNDLERPVSDSDRVRL